MAGGSESTAEDAPPPRGLLRAAGARLRQPFREFARALSYVPRYKREVTIGLLAVPCARALELAIPWVLKTGIDDLVAGVLRAPLYAYVLLVVLLGALKGVFKFVMRHQLVGASRRFEEDLRNDVYAHLLTLPPSYFQRARSGDLMARATSDVEAVRMFLGPGTMYVAETILVLPAALGVLATFSWRLSLLLVFPLVLIAWAMVHWADAIHEESGKAQESLSELSNAAQENFAGVRVARAFAREREEIERFSAASATYLRRNLRAVDVRSRSWACILAARDLGVLVLLLGGCFELLAGRISAGEFFMFHWCLNLLFWPMVALGWMVAMYQRGRASMRRLNEVLAEPPAVVPPAAPYAPERVRGKVEFRGLRLVLDDQVRLDGIDLVVEPGRVVGVTGRTGSGKSMLAQVLPRLVPVAPGQVFVDDVDVTGWDLPTLRRAVGYVQQEAFLFADTVRGNLALGRDDDELEPVAAAARVAHVDAELEALPQGYESVVGERGVTLSGGQRQRATIARAIAADPRILVLDDCLSAVDADTEARVLKDLTRALSGRTAILVSHRVAALALADEVIVLDEGRIVERGAPKDLLQKDGRYRALHLRQRAAEELERMP